MKTIIACDPGVSGGFAVLRNEGIELHPMPETITDTLAFLRSQISASTTLVIEELPHYVDAPMPKSAVFKMAQNFGRIEGIALALGFRLERVHPKQWQKHYGMTRNKRKSSEWKRALRCKASELYPHLNPTLKTADALLILEWFNNKKGE